MPVPKLLERDEALRRLEVALQETGAGEGRIALVSGEAGIGKTSLVDRFLATRATKVRVLKGSCDALFTPAPLAPLHDMARQAGGREAAAVVIGNNAKHGVTLVHSYVTPDKKHTFCVYDGPTPEAIRKVAEMNGLPVERITEVRVLDPYFHL